MSEKNPLTDEQISIAADICDAVDPSRNIDQRIDACERASRRDPEFALLVATQLLYGAIEASPNPAETIAALRSRIAQDRR